MKLNQKGAALMQVLLVALILSGIATMLLRASLSRTTSSRKTRRTVSAQVLIQACMAEVNALWAAKTPKAYYRDITGIGKDGNNLLATKGPVMYCDQGASENACTKPEYAHTCIFTNPYTTDTSAQFKVKASFEKDANDVWQMKYEIINGAEYL